MVGRLHQINIGSGGVPKLPVDKVVVTQDRLVGDSWTWEGHGGPNQAVCLYSLECLAKLEQQGFRVFPGALGENFTTKGLDYPATRIGDVYRVGPEVEIQITRPREPCGTIVRAYRPQSPEGNPISSAMWDDKTKQGDTSSPLWGMSGFYARVIREGTVQANDLIRLLERAQSK